MNIHKSFAHGKTGETFIKDLMNKASIECEFNEEHELRYDHDLDCKLGKKKFTIEVKFDMMAQKTGNLAIEYFNTRKNEASGLTSTKADLWAHVVLDQNYKTAWITSVQQLKDYVDQNHPFRIIENAGDGNAALYLYKDFQILEAVFTRIDNIDQDKLKKVIRGYLK